MDMTRQLGLMDEAAELLVKGAEEGWLPTPFEYAGLVFWAHGIECRCLMCRILHQRMPAVREGMAVVSYHPLAMPGDQLFWRTWLPNGPEVVDCRDGAAYIICSKYLSPGGYIRASLN